MRIVTITNLNNVKTNPVSARYCSSFFSNFRGLMLHPGLAPYEGCLLVQSRESRIDAGIHMLFMRFDIAVIWLNSHFQVVDVQRANRWQPMLLPRLPAMYVLETHVERLNDFQIGDQLSIADE